MVSVQVSVLDATGKEIGNQKAFIYNLEKEEKKSLKLIFLMSQTGQGLTQRLLI